MSIPPEDPLNVVSIRATFLGCFKSDPPDPIPDGVKYTISFRIVKALSYRQLRLLAKVVFSTSRTWFDQVPAGVVLVDEALRDIFGNYVVGNDEAIPWFFSAAEIEFPCRVYITLEPVFYDGDPSSPFKPFDERILL